MFMLFGLSAPCFLVPQGFATFCGHSARFHSDSSVSFFKEEKLLITPAEFYLKMNLKLNGNKISF
jgi:hypothetical protein